MFDWLLLIVGLADWAVSHSFPARLSSGRLGELQRRSMSDITMQGAMPRKSISVRS